MDVNHEAPSGKVGWRRDIQQIDILKNATHSIMPQDAHTECRNAGYHLC